MSDRIVHVEESCLGLDVLIVSTHKSQQKRKKRRQAGKAKGPKLTKKQRKKRNVLK
jgi:hypothetical protein